MRRIGTLTLATILALLAPAAHGLTWVDDDPDGVWLGGPQSVRVGETVTFEAFVHEEVLVDPEGGGFRAGHPDEPVLLLVDGAPYANATTDATGVATFTLAFDARGTRVLQAVARPGAPTEVRSHDRDVRVAAPPSGFAFDAAPGARWDELEITWSVEDTGGYGAYAVFRFWKHGQAYEPRARYDEGQGLVRFLVDPNAQYRIEGYASNPVGVSATAEDLITLARPPENRFTATRADVYLCEWWSTCRAIHGGETIVLDGGAWIRIRAEGALSKQGSPTAEGEPVYVEHRASMLPSYAGDRVRWARLLAGADGRFEHASGDMHLSFPPETSCQRLEIRVTFSTFPETIHDARAITICKTWYAP